MILPTLIISTALLILVLPGLLRKPNRGNTPFILLAIAIALILCLSSLQYIKTDDEYITFRVVDNFVNGKGLVYNPGERYVGITNIGWAIILSALPIVGLSLEFGARWISLVSALFCLWGVSRLGENLGGKKAGIAAPFLLLFTPFFHYWSTAGLETMAFCALCAWSLALATAGKRFPFYAVTAAIAVWLRPETPLIFIACVLLNIWTVNKPAPLRNSIISVLIFSFSLAGFFLFRYLNYGTLLMATATSKIPTAPINFQDGISVLTTSITYSPILFLGMALCLPLLRDKRILVLFLTSLCGILYYMWLGFDTMKQERLLAPFIPGMIALLAAGLASWQIGLGLNRTGYGKRLSLSLVMGLLVISPYYQALEKARTMHNGLVNAHLKLADYLQLNGSSQDAIAVQDAGVIGYLWQGKIIDLSGIFDPTIIAIHKEFGRVSNNSQNLPQDELRQMNHLVADYVLDQVKPRYIVLVFTYSKDGALIPSKHNHRLGEDPRFSADYAYLQKYYYSPTYILELYQRKS
jgi:hypothetical protein